MIQMSRVASTRREGLGRLPVIFPLSKRVPHRGLPHRVSHLTITCCRHPHPHHMLHWRLRLYSSSFQVRVPIPEFPIRPRVPVSLETVNRIQEEVLLFRHLRVIRLVGVGRAHMVTGGGEVRVRDRVSPLGFLPIQTR